MSAGANQQLIVNELLVFLQRKLDVIQICFVSFFVSDICIAKQTQYQSLNRSGVFGSHPRGDQTGNFDNILKVLKETDPDMFPTFVDGELLKLPWVTFDHVEVSCLLKEDVALKASLAEVQNSRHRKQ